MGSPSPSLHILDVGHGNCCIIVDTKGVTIVDAARTRAHVEFLKKQGIDSIRTILISHADSDHIAGIMHLLLESDLKVDEIYLNPDAFKQNKTWEGLRKALAFARRSCGTIVHTQLTTTISRKIRNGTLDIEVLAPTPEMAAGGAGSTDLNGNRITSNSMSAVIRVLKDGSPILLLPADLDSTALDNLEAEHTNITAQIAVFPHHGGHPGGKEKAEDFAARFLKAVGPELVVFSIGRGRYDLPLPEIVQIVGTAPMMCTQLSENCAKHLPHKLVSGASRVGQAAFASEACAGMVSVDCSGDEIQIQPEIAAHRNFVKIYVPDAECLKHLSKASRLVSIQSA